MRGKGRNEAFFQQSAADGYGDRGSLSTNLSRLCRAARETGKLNLSSKSLTSVPDAVFSLENCLEEGEKFWEINPLSRLDLSHNRIVGIATGKFPSIAEDLLNLKLRDNQLTQPGLPLDLFACAKLRYLDLGTNRLECVPDEIGQLSDLRELSVSENRLTSLPSSLGSCSLLQTLEAQGNLITNMPFDALRLPQLLKLDLSNNKLRELPLSISNLTLLESLDVSKNGLVSMPNLANLRSLTFLNMSENRLTGVPPLPVNGKLDRLYMTSNSLQQLDVAAIAPSANSLTELLLQGNQLASCPEELYVAANLKILDLSNNALGNLPHTLGYMNNLQKILVEGNPIRTIRRTLLSSPTAHDLKTYLRTRGPPPPPLNASAFTSSTAMASTGAGTAPSSRHEKEGGDVGVRGGPGGQTGGAARGDINMNYNRDNGMVLSAVDEELLSQVEWRIRDATGAAIDLSNIRLSASQFTSFVYDALERSHLYNTLVSLNLASNQLAVVPPVLMHLPALKRLNVSGNLLGRASMITKNTTGISRGARLGSTNVSGRAVGSPDHAYAGNSQSVRVSAGAGASGGDTVGVRVAEAFPPTLTALDISNNKLNSEEFACIVDTLCSQRIELQELLVGGNMVTVLPPLLFRQRKLRELQLCRNQLAALAVVEMAQGVSAAGRPQAQSLYQYQYQNQRPGSAHYNRNPDTASDGSVLADFTVMPALEVLDMSDNRLTSLDDVRFPVSLQTLMLSNNDLTDLPTHLVALTRLNTLTLTGNPIRSIRPNVVAQGAAAVIAVLQNRLPTPAPAPASASATAQVPSPPAPASARGDDVRTRPTSSSAIVHTRRDDYNHDQDYGYGTESTSYGHDNGRARLPPHPFSTADRYASANASANTSSSGNPDGRADDQLSKLSLMRLEMEQSRYTSSSSSRYDRDGRSGGAVAKMNNNEYALVDAARARSGVSNNDYPASYRSSAPSSARGNRNSTTGADSHSTAFPSTALNPKLADIAPDSGSRSVTTSMTQKNSIETLNRELAALEAELERCSDMAKKTQIRKSMALKRSNILRLTAQGPSFSL